MVMSELRVVNVIVLLLAEIRDRGEVSFMLEELEVAAEVEGEVVESVVTEDQEEITVNKDEDDHEQMIGTRRHDIKCQHRPFTTISNTSFENRLIYD